MTSLAHGKIIRLSDRLRRITAPNPGLMTGAGTNTYILGNKDVAIVDPGPFDSSGSGSVSSGHLLVEHENRGVLMRPTPPAML